LSSKEELEHLQRELCITLARIGAVRFGMFTLSAGRLSPYYIDLRIVPSFPDAYKTVEDIYIFMAKELIGLESFDRIAGIPTAGIPFASVMAYSLHKPFIYVRKEVKTHGRERKVEGILHPGDRVLLVDDVVTTGGSLLTAAEAVVAEGGIVRDALVLIDREEGGKNALYSKGIRLNCFINISEAAQILHLLGTISGDELKLILKQIRKRY
jgi:orotate phosphoribosyltransferase